MDAMIVPTTTVTTPAELTRAVAVTGLNLETAKSFRITKKNVLAHARSVASEAKVPRAPDFASAEVAGLVGAGCDELFSAAKEPSFLAKDSAPAQTLGGWP